MGNCVNETQNKYFSLSAHRDLELLLEDLDDGFYLTC